MVEGLLMARAQFLLDANTGRYSLAMSPQNCGFEHDLHALKNASRRLGLRKPDRCQQVDDLPRFDLSDRPIANCREDVAFHCRLPLRGMLLIRQALAFTGKKFFESLAKRYATCVRQSPGALALFNRISAGEPLQPALGSPFPSRCKL